MKTKNKFRKKALLIYPSVIGIIPLGLAYIASIFRKNNYEVKVKDIEVDEIINWIT